MRARSLKRQKQDREVNDLARFAAACSGRSCMLCCFHQGAEVHHLWGRNGKLRHHIANLFFACRECHEELIPITPPKVLYRLKKLRDHWACDDEVARELSRNKNGRIDL
jgi:5-methylcytosine-specific restriction endonuclease McrA